MMDRNGVEIRVGDRVRWDSTNEGCWYEVVSLNDDIQGGELHLQPKGEVFKRAGLGGCEVLSDDKVAQHKRQLQELRDIRARANCRCTRPDGSSIDVIPLVEYERLSTSLKESHTRNCKLSDANGELKTQNTELLAENATLRRELERVTRKAQRP